MTSCVRHKTGTLTLQNKLTLGMPFVWTRLHLTGRTWRALASRSENDDTIGSSRVPGGLKDKDAPKPYQSHHFTPFYSVLEHRGDRQGRGRQDIQGDQGRAPGIYAMSANAAALPPVVAGG